MYKEFVYLLKYEYCYDYDTHEDMTIYKYFDDAKEQFDKLVKEAKETLTYDTTDETIDFFEIYNDGWYPQAHTTITIIEKEVK